MTPFSKIRTEIVRGLSSAIGVKVIEANSPGDSPRLPFGVYDISDPMYAPGGQPVKVSGYSSTTLSEMAEFTVDFQFAAADRMAAMELALRARDWFVADGHDILKYGPAATIVVTVDDVENRDVQIGDDWNYQYGFEVRFRTTNSITYASTTIEKATIREVDPIG